MKKLLLLAGLALFAAPLLAQDEEDLNNDDRAALKKLKEGEGVVLDSGKVWTKGGVFQLNFSQVQLVNWAAGGFSSVSGL
ncbi:MAG: hypothetical protein KDB87_13085, partial [Flavobacteriales bacterium]|nr:hypothetical protein [Flavobacteriales bacterium]